MALDHSGDGPVDHNSVLIRTHELARSSHTWLLPALLGGAVVIGAAVWVWVESHPAPPIVNHAVESTQ